MSGIDIDRLKDKPAPAFGAGPDGLGWGKGKLRQRQGCRRCLCPRRRRLVSFDLKLDAAEETAAVDGSEGRPCGDCALRTAERSRSQRSHSDPVADEVRVWPLRPAAGIAESRRAATARSLQARLAAYRCSGSIRSARSLKAEALLSGILILADGGPSRGAG